MCGPFHNAMFNLCFLVNYSLIATFLNNIPHSAHKKTNTPMTASKYCGLIVHQLASYILGGKGLLRLFSEDKDIPLKWFVFFKYNLIKI